MHSRIKTLLADALHCARLSQYEKAIKLCERVLALDSRILAARKLLAQLHYMSGAPDKALCVLQEIVSIWPQNRDAIYEMGCLYLECGSIDRAENVFNALLGADGTLFPSACSNMGYIKQKQGRLDEAVKWYIRALKYHPEDLKARYNLGTAYHEIGRMQEAIELFRQVLNKNPQHAAACNMLGVTEQEAGHADAAMGWFKRALEISPSFADAHRNLAEVMLQSGDFVHGWEEYEWRLRKPDHVMASTYGLPIWKSESLEKKDILVVQEQGIGDEIMFARCIEELQAVAGACYYACDMRLVPLFRRSFPSLIILTDKDFGEDSHTPSEKIDLAVPIGSLPRAVRFGKEVLCPADKYLQADARRCAAWKKVLTTFGSGMKIGISWRGGAGGRVSARRSIPLQQWSPLLSKANAVFFSLQYGHHSQEIEDFCRKTGLTLHQLPGLDASSDIDGLAACMTELDLVISVDNATGHLAGALGVPTWVLLPYVADWRWQRTGVSSVWYASIRLLRQDARQEWKSVINETGVMLDSYKFERHR